MKKLFQRHDGKSGDADQNVSSASSSAASAPGKKRAGGKHACVHLLEFRCRGKLLCSAKTDDLGPVVRIGRGADNDWIVPPQDRVSADHQAELRIGSRELRLQACGKEVFHLRGRAMASAVLRSGDRVSIGDCELFVKSAEVQDAAPCDVHRLEFLNGPREGEMIRLEKNLVRIGSAPENDVVLRDDVVSHFHAEIRITENGESWIRDLNSVNGTFVNGDRLGRQERMLMDSDEIAIAFFDLRFLDRHVPHTRSQIGRKILIMGGTMLAILLCFALFYASTPEAAQVLSAAEFYIRRADFGAARRVLDRMPESRNFQQYEKHYQEHLKNIARYERTFASWQEFKRLLKSSEWQDAAKCFGLLEVDNRFAWNWEDATVDERMALVRHAKSLLDQLFRMRTLLASMDSDPEAQREMLREWERNPLSRPAKQEPEWLQPLRTEIGGLEKELKNNCAIFEKMNLALDSLKEESVDFRKLIADLREMQTKASGSVRVRARDLADVLSQLEKNQTDLSANQTALTSMRFGEIRENLAFVSPDECMIHSRIMEKRNQLVRRQESLLRNGKTLKFFLEKWKKAGLTPERVPEMVDRFASGESLKKALRFECLNGKMPDPRRKTPAGEYDRMFGIRFFYEIIQQSAVLPTNLYSADAASGLTLLPECIALASLYRTVEETHLWLSLPENQWMLRGKMLALRRQCDLLRKRRTDMLALLNRMAESAPGTRTYFVAKAAWFYFSLPSTVPRKEMERYAAAWKKYRAGQQDRLESYDPLKPREAEQLGKAILADGIPGDPVVNWVWSQKND